MKVYLVERGCYSDRYTAGVFSTRELAEADVALHADGERDGWNSEGSIEEYIVDENVGNVKRDLFTAEIDLESGELLRQLKHVYHVSPHERGKLGDVCDFRHMQKSGVCPAFGRITQEATSFESAEHARKLAVEARQAWLREHNLTA